MQREIIEVSLLAKTAKYRPALPVPALLVMVAALLLLSAGPALSGDFAGTLPTHAHVFLGTPHTTHSHDFNPDGDLTDDAVNVSSNEAGFVALGVVAPPEIQALTSVDAAPWLHRIVESFGVPGGLNQPPPQPPPIS